MGTPKKTIYTDNTRKGRSFIRTVEGSGKERKIVYRVADNHTAAFYEQHPKGSIYFSTPVNTSQTLQGNLSRAGQGLRRALDTRVFASKNLKTGKLPKKLKDLPGSTRGKGLLSLKHHAKISEFVSTKEYNIRGMVGTEFEFTFIRANKERVARYTGYSKRSSEPISRLTEPKRASLIEDARKSAQGQFLLETGVDAYSESIKITRVGDIHYRYFVSPQQLGRLRL